MIKHIDHKGMGKADHGWLNSHFHFSFAEYFNPENMQFGVLRVLNDDMVQSGEGFDTHPHQDMEIISYVVQGELTHGDSMGNKRTLTRGQVQYMSAGTGVLHSEFNLGKDLLRFLQVWILPDKKGYKPNYGDYRFNIEDRRDKWLPLAAETEHSAETHPGRGSPPDNQTAPIRIHQDINAYAAIISEGKSLGFDIGENRQAYFVQIEGSAKITGAMSGQTADLVMRDAAEITGENITVNAEAESHVLVIEMGKGK
jgi:redox-sensitive bicupin YhaK (pirin superfamily)